MRQAEAGQWWWSVVVVVVVVVQWANPVVYLVI